MIIIDYGIKLRKSFFQSESQQGAKKDLDLINYFGSSLYLVFLSYAINGFAWL